MTDATGIRDRVLNEFTEEEFMMFRIRMIAACGLLALAGWASGQSPAAGSGRSTLDAAAKKGAYTFVVFHKENDAATQAMRRAVTAALAKNGRRAEVVSVSLGDASEKALVDHWGLSRSPMPLALAVAPNGAVTGGFPLKVTEADVTGAFVSAATADCLKATQARKIVLLSVRPAGAELPAGVREFKADATFGPATEVVTVRADDADEAGFLKTLGIKAANATAVIVPPGSLLGTFDGTVTKAALVEKVKSAGGCCPGGKCGPGGCCPPAKTEPRR